MTDTHHLEHTSATIRFNEPDDSIGPENRGLFAFSAQKRVVEEEIKLHNARTSLDVVKGPEGLDIQGFAYIQHRSILHNSDQWFSGQNVEDIYLPEVTKLICQVTGAKRAVVNNVAFRRKLATNQADPSYFRKKGDPQDKELAKLPRDRITVYGKEEGGSLEPARAAHIDYSIEGLRRTARECRKDIVEAAKQQLEAEDRVKNGEAVEVPRYAAYSVWRPVHTVHRDPLAVCDWRSVDKDDIHYGEQRALSEINANGEYTMQLVNILPPKEPSTQKWYWMPEQKPDEVLIVKFADTAAEKDPSIAIGCPHCSPQIPGTEDEEARVSIEARVLAFW